MLKRQNNFLLLFFVSLIFFYCYIFFAKTVNGDEAILAEQAKELAAKGYVCSPMFTGLGEGWENSQLHYHKLFIWEGALIYKMFGTSLHALRTLSFLFAVLLLIMIYKILKFEEERENKFLFTSILLLSNYVVFEYGLIYRPEVAVSGLAVCSFYFIQKGIEQNSIKMIIISSIIAGLAALIHLNGLSLLFAGSILLLWNKKIKHGFIFGTIGTICSLFYFIDINSIEKFIQFKTQFFCDPNFEKGNFDAFAPVFKILNEHMRFFHDIYSISFSILFFVVLIFSFKHLNELYKNLLRYFLLLVIGLAAITHGATVKYAMIYYPFMCLIITYGLFHAIKENRKVKKVYIFLIALFLVINLFFSIRNAFGFQNTVKRAAYISSYIPEKNSTIFAPEYFYFNQESWFNIRIQMAYKIRNNDYKRGEWTIADFYNYNQNNNNKYILLDSFFTDKMILKSSDYENLMKGDTLFNYKVIHVEQGIKILQNKN